MKSFCISLEKHRDTWPELTNYFLENGISDVTIFPGINGKNIGQYFETKNSQVLGPSESALIENVGGVEKMVSTWGLYHLYNHTNRRDHAQLGSWGAVGCYLSHANIWKKMLDEKIDSAIIFEDDVQFNSGFKDRFEKFMKNLPSDGDVFFLDVSVNFKPLKYDDMFDKILGQFWGLHAYIMTNKGAQKLLPFVYPIEIQIDSLIGYSASLNRLKLYTAKDLCGQKTHISSIQTACMICDIDDKEINKYKSLTKTFIYIFLFIVVLLIIFMFIYPAGKASFRYIF
uniref:Glycosyl transferase family 25 domain-containing protein n=1 Tax=viral metagenome TaxID=1070528 RepID=A0A6C0KU45_9ZZZZ